jgi:hypothetical protein
MGSRLVRGRGLNGWESNSKFKNIFSRYDKMLRI